MNIDGYHPNFPPSLAITPNSDPVEIDRSQCPSESHRKDAFGVEAQQEAISRFGIAGRVWEAAYAMCAYVDPADTLDFDPPFMESLDDHPIVIELGSGTGLVAATIAKVIASTRSCGFVIATDLPDTCPLLQHNLSAYANMNASAGKDRSGRDAIYVRPLTWGVLDHVATIVREFRFDNPVVTSPPRRLTHIVCSDLVYFPELLGPLLRTLIHLTSPPCAPLSGLPIKIIMSYKIRSLSKETPFWAALGLWFSFRPVLTRCRVQPTDNGTTHEGEQEPWVYFGAQAHADQTFVFVAHRRPESMAWHVPETDPDLMEGVGAQGTCTTKADDTFETMLFMGIGVGE